MNILAIFVNHSVLLAHIHAEKNACCLIFYFWVNCPTCLISAEPHTLVVGLVMGFTVKSISPPALILSFSTNGPSWNDIVTLSCGSLWLFVLVFYYYVISFVWFGCSFTTCLCLIHVDWLCEISFYLNFDSLQGKVEIHKDCSHFKLVTLSLAEQKSPKLPLRHSLWLSKLSDSLWSVEILTNVVLTQVSDFSVVSLLLYLQYEYEDI